eukprot:g24206.t1
MSWRFESGICMPCGFFALLSEKNKECLRQLDFASNFSLGKSCKAFVFFTIHARRPCFPRGCICHSIEDNEEKAAWRRCGGHVSEGFCLRIGPPPKAAACRLGHRVLSYVDDNGEPERVPEQGDAASGPRRKRRRVGPSLEQSQQLSSESSSDEMMSNCLFPMQLREIVRILLRGFA